MPGSYRGIRWSNNNSSTRAMTNRSTAPSYTQRRTEPHPEPTSSNQRTTDHDISSMIYASPSPINWDELVSRMTTRSVEDVSSQVIEDSIDIEVPVEESSQDEAIVDELYGTPEDQENEEPDSFRSEHYQSGLFGFNIPRARRTIPNQPISGNTEVITMPTVASTFGMRASYPTIESHPLIVGTNLAGVEIELENLGEVSHPRFQYWSSKEDGSLRNGGIEYVCSSPWGGRDLYNAAIEIDSFLFNNTPDETWRCSTHVHVDVRDMTEEEVKKMILAYLFYERPLFRCSGFHRYRNNFCVALGFAQEYIDILSDNWNKENFLSHIVVNWNKYTAMNLCPMSSFGSIEFRISEAKWRKGRLIRLVNRFLSLKEVAKGFEGTDEEFLEMLNSTPIEKVIRKGLPKKCPDFSKDLSIGYKLCNDILSRSKIRRRTITTLIPEETSVQGDRVYNMTRGSYHTAGWDHTRNVLSTRTEYRLPDSKPLLPTFSWVNKIQTVMNSLESTFEPGWFFRDPDVLQEYLNWRRTI